MKIAINNYLALIVGISIPAIYTLMKSDGTDAQSRFVIGFFAAAITKIALDIQSIAGRGPTP